MAVVEDLFVSLNVMKVGMRIPTKMNLSQDSLRYAMAAYKLPMREAFDSNPYLLAEVLP